MEVEKVISSLVYGISGRISDDASCYMVNICVGYDGKPTMELLEY